MAGETGEIQFTPKETTTDVLSVKQTQRPAFSPGQAMPLQIHREPQEIRQQIRQQQHQESRSLPEQNLPTSDLRRKNDPKVFNEQELQVVSASVAELLSTAPEITIDPELRNNPFFIMAFDEEYSLTSHDMGGENPKAAIRIAARAATRTAHSELQLQALQKVNDVLFDRYEDMKETKEIDSLTGILNRGGFDRRLLRVILDSDNPFVIAILDVNKLKFLNDNYGHGVGDNLIKGVASAMSDATRNSDVIARYGGDEMAAILPKTTVEEAQVVLSRINEESDKYPIEQLGPNGIGYGGGSIEIDPKEFRGLTIDQINERIKDLLLQAEGAMYAAKEQVKSGNGSIRGFLSAKHPEAIAKYQELKAKKDLKATDRQ